MGQLGAAQLLVAKGASLVYCSPVNGKNAHALALEAGHTAVAGELKR